MDNSIHKFSKEELTVTFDPKKCINAECCARELSDVFRTSVIPWIDLDGAPNKRLIEQIKRCPSGALSYVQTKAQPQTA